MATPSELFTTALAHHQSGNLQQAEALCREVLQAEPAHAQAHQLLGLLAHRAGHHEVAIALLRRAVGLNPDEPNCHFDLGAVLASRARIAEAVACYREALRLNLNHAQAHNNLGNALKSQGQLTEAILCYRQALRCNPDSANAHYNLGNALTDQGQTDEAIVCYRQVLRINPERTDAYVNLGSALKVQGHPEEAGACFRQALHIDPQHVDAHNNLGVILRDQGQPAEASACFRQCLQINPRQADACINLGIALKDQGQLDEATTYLRRALSINPQNADAHIHLGNALKDQGQLEKAIACYRDALAINPRHADALVNLGNALKDRGQLRKALACYRRGARLKPDGTVADSNVLNMLHFDPGYDGAAIYQEHRRWYKRHAQPLEPLMRPHANDRSPERRLRIGYISPDFRNHCQAFFTVPLFGAHDHESFGICCYADVLVADGITRRLQGCADVWRNIAGLGDEHVAGMVRQDRIDILVDLTMHMGRNRLLVLARKPAPVQACWLAYPGTTGLESIDYRISDPYLDPPGFGNGPYSEKSVRLPDTFWCYDPLTSVPAVNALPADKNGYLTFGCLNNFCKVNDFTLGLWAKAMRAVRSSHLVLLAPEGRPRGRVLHVLKQEGIAPDRIRFVARQPRLAYLEMYHQIDVGLDTLPYNGHTTSLDSTWMGVPVVTMVGQTVVGRAGACQLHNLGLRELAAATPEEFRDNVLMLAGDLQRLRILRATLRERMVNSPLMDAPRFVRHLEAAFRNMWRQWCIEASAPVPTEKGSS
ncbi:MAG TPA: tetratricopeptide repeat protein [Gemmataceae bacterium]|jgi:protein O-GlcNAc transferase|nr:tetratricopeptide repeat protein [Gemmataceae bacterium]